MKIVTADEMREIDRVTSQRFGVPSLTLMENAGTAVAEFVLSRYPSAKRIAVICGKGNNGGDGFVAARKLHESGKEVGVALLASSSELKVQTGRRRRIKIREPRSSGPLRPGLHTAAVSADWAEARFALSGTAPRLWQSLTVRN